ncbi:hypothetical protein BESB_048530 [Besnoitia besnoiti]|uniref:Ras family protein n=1 Tax=Besnoitia besnoiti TaxID=94643 RepID=A0A2A9MK67_BESBE|nr:hypothetical protein BESB_048530 [Besnoitia besnoiti]PFH36661.1 hypothetical protein BESB_048530 [Besnoitia besnoiti]
MRDPSCWQFPSHSSSQESEAVAWAPPRGPGQSGAGRFEGEGGEATACSALSPAGCPLPPFSVPSASVSSSASLTPLCYAVRSVPSSPHSLPVPAPPPVPPPVAIAPSSFLSPPRSPSLLPSCPSSSSPPVQSSSPLVSPLHAFSPSWAPDLLSRSPSPAVCRKRTEEFSSVPPSPEWRAESRFPTSHRSLLDSPVCRPAVVAGGGVAAGGFLSEGEGAAPPGGEIGSEEEDDGASVASSSSDASTAFLRILVVGDQGTGKSFLLHSLCHSPDPQSEFQRPCPAHRGRRGLREQVDTRASDAGAADEKSAPRQDGTGSRLEHSGSRAQLRRGTPDRRDAVHGVGVRMDASEQLERDADAPFSSFASVELTEWPRRADAETGGTQAGRIRGLPEDGRPRAEPRASEPCLAESCVSAPSEQSGDSTSVPRSPSLSPSASPVPSPSSSFSFSLPTSFCPASSSRPPAPVAPPRAASSSSPASSSAAPVARAASAEAAAAAQPAACEDASRQRECTCEADEQQCPACRLPGSYEWTCGVRIFHMFWELPPRERGSKDRQRQSSPGSSSSESSADSLSERGRPAASYPLLPESDASCASGAAAARSAGAATRCLVEFWEVGGTEMLESVRSLAYGQEFDGVWVCFDSRSAASFHHAALWTRELCVHLHLPSSLLFPSSGPQAPLSLAPRSYEAAAPSSSLRSFLPAPAVFQSFACSRRVRRWRRHQEHNAAGEARQRSAEGAAHEVQSLTSFFQMLPTSTVGKVTRAAASAVVRLGSTVASPVVSLVAGERERETDDSATDREEDEMARLKPEREGRGRRKFSAKPSRPFRKGSRRTARFASSLLTSASSVRPPPGMPERDGEEEPREDGEGGGTSVEEKDVELGVLEGGRETLESPADAECRADTASAAKEGTAPTLEAAAFPKGQQGAGPGPEDPDGASSRAFANLEKELTHQQFAVRLLQGVCPVLLVGTKEDLLLSSTAARQTSNESAGGGCEVDEKGLSPFLKHLRSRASVLSGFLSSSSPEAAAGCAVGEDDEDGRGGEAACRASDPSCAAPALCLEEDIGGGTPSRLQTPFSRAYFTQNSFVKARDNIFARLCGTLGPRRVPSGDARLALDGDAGVKLNRRICHLLNSSPLVLTSAVGRTVDPAALSAFFSDALLCQTLFRERSREKKVRRRSKAKSRGARPPVDVMQHVEDAPALLSPLPSPSLRASPGVALSDSANVRRVGVGAGDAAKQTAPVGEAEDGGATPPHARGRAQQPCQDPRLGEERELSADPEPRESPVAEDRPAEERDGKLDGKSRPQTPFSDVAAAAVAAGAAAAAIQWLH